ncbi:MAG: ferritin [Gemmatimonadota bacterium]|nr:ferritin [Gemmatimonadota bacterium]
MISEALTREINEQIKFELYSAYMYLAMSADCSDRNLTGFAHWLTQQAEEEVAHAMRFYHFLLERGARVELMAIDQPPHQFGSPLEIMEKSLEHERFVTGRINGLYKLAVSEGDYPAQVLLQWFVTEQVEEESSIGEIVERMRMFGVEGPALLMLDTQLGSRPAEDGEE